MEYTPINLRANNWCSLIFALSPRICVLFTPFAHAYSSIHGTRIPLMSSHVPHKMLHFDRGVLPQTLTVFMSNARVKSLAQGLFLQKCPFYT